MRFLCAACERLPLNTAGFGGRLPFPRENMLQAIIVFSVLGAQFGHAVSKGVANFSGTADGIDLLTMRIPIFEIIDAQPYAVFFPYPLNPFSFPVLEMFFFILRIRSPHDAGIYRLSICNIRI